MKNILFIVTFIFLFFNIHVKSMDKFHSGDKYSKYLSGILSLSENEYEKSYFFLKKVTGLEDYHFTYSQLYIYSLINIDRFDDAFRFARKLELRKINNFETDLIIGIYHLNNKKFDLAQKYFKKNFERKNLDPLQKLISSFVYSWSLVDEQSFNTSKKKFDLIEKRFQKIKNIQKTFLHCFYDQGTAQREFENLINDKSANFNRYRFFYANYFLERNDKNNAFKIINQSLEESPRNLLINQLKLDILNKKKFNNKFSCAKKQDIIAELFYLISNALSSQNLYSVSNFYLNIAKYLNPNFIAFDVLYAENLNLAGNKKQAKNLYNKIKNFGDTYNWFATKEITDLLLNEKKNIEALNYLGKGFNNLTKPNIFQKMEFANYLKNNEKYNEAIKIYNEIAKEIDEKHFLYSRLTDERGVCYERIGNWEKAEIDLKASLKADPNQAYVLNYLAYSWIEKNININESLKMLRRANEIRKQDPYIIDSLGWALFKLNRFTEAKQYIQQAVKLMPEDPIVNDHYADVLWKLEKKIQARYYWNYVLNLDETEKELKLKIKNKLAYGLKSII